MHWQDPIHFERPFARPEQLPPVLQNPPWRVSELGQGGVSKPVKSSKKTKAAELVLEAPPMAPQLRWTPELARQAQRPASPERGTEWDVGEALNLFRTPEGRVLFEQRSPEGLAAWDAALAARDPVALCAATEALHLSHLTGRKPAWSDRFFLYTQQWHKLDEMTVPLFNGFAGAYVFGYPEPVISSHGLALLPGMRAWAQRDFASGLRFFRCYGDEGIAREAVRLALSGKETAKYGREWLRTWPEYAAAVLLPDVVVGKAKAKAQASSLLLGLMRKGKREAILRAARRLDAVMAERAPQPQGEQAPAAVGALATTGAVEAAALALLDADPLLHYPSNTSLLFTQWASETWHLPVLHTGERFSPEAASLVAEMLRFPSEDGRYAGLAQVREACTPDSLDGFCHALLMNWFQHGAHSSTKWQFRAIAALGSDPMAAWLAQSVRKWPTEGFSARAVAGLEVMAEMGTDGALREIAKIAEKVKSASLKSKAQQMMNKIALERGLSAADLADRLVPEFDLDAKGHTLLHFGPRQFLLGVDEQLKPFVREWVDGVAGRPLAKLPAAKASDDAALATAATKRFKLIAKETKAIASSQIKRLEHAMRMGRRWSVDEFTTVYAQHPLLRQLATRLIWAVYPAVDPESSDLQAATRQPVLASFRLSAEGEWLDPDESPIDMQALAAMPAAQTHGLAIGIAHPLELSAQTVAAHAQQLADYELLQPFEQLAREVSRDLMPETHQTRITQALAKPFEPLKLLGLESRGWAAERDSGMIRRFVTDLRGGGVLEVWIEHGIVLSAPKDSGLQDAHASLSMGKLGSASWADVSALAVSDVLRDLAQVA